MIQYYCCTFQVHSSTATPHPTPPFFLILQTFLPVLQLNMSNALPHHFQSATPWAVLYPATVIAPPSPSHTHLRPHSHTHTTPTHIHPKPTRRRVIDRAALKYEGLKCCAFSRDAAKTYSDQNSHSRARLSHSEALGLITS